jgi:heat shock protein HslJ
MAKLLGLLTFLAAIMMISACSSSGSPDFVDQSWLLATLLGEPPLADTTITMEFGEGDRVAGSSGCNQYSTTYTVDGNQLSFGDQIATTMMACLGPIVQQERAYLQALAATKTYDLAQDGFTLFDADGNQLAAFVVVSQSLAGTSWQVLGYNNGRGGVVSVIVGTEITANFDESRVTGNSGCNTYSAQYETQGDQLNIGTAEVTEMACLEPEGVMQQEQQYLAALSMAEVYQVQGNRLEMRTSGGSLMVNFQKVP